MNPLEFAPLVGTVFEAVGAGAQNAANAEQAELNRRFQERMSSTAWQRAVKDMRAAGLNPALAYQQGGASAPVGDSARMENVMQGASRAASSAAEIALSRSQTRANVDFLQAQAENKRAETDQLKLESLQRYAFLRAQIEQLGARRGVDIQEAARIHTDTYRLGEEGKTAEYRSEQERVRMENAMQLMRLEIAQKMASLGLTEKEISSIDLDMMLRRFAIPRARAEAGMYGTEFGTRMLPWITTAADVVNNLPIRRR